MLTAAVLESLNDLTLADEPAAAPHVTAIVSAAEWDEFVTGHPGASAYHLYEWRRVFERAFGHRCEYLAAFDWRGRVAGVLPLVVFANPLFGRALVSLPFVNHGGVLADTPAAARALLDEAAERGRRAGARHLELRHATPRFPELPSRSHRVAMVAAVPRSEEAAWSGLDRKVRNHVRKGQKSGLTVEDGGAELLRAFYAVFAENMRDLGTPVYPAAFFEEMFRQYPDRTRAFVVRFEGKPVAGSVTLAWRNTFEVPSASSLKAFRSRSPNYLLYWEMFKYAIDHGFEAFDFGRSAPGDGTYVFKEAWGAKPGPLCWEYRLLAQSDVPALDRRGSRLKPVIAVWQKLPLPIANFLGPRVVRYLP